MSERLPQSGPGVARLRSRRQALGRIAGAAVGLTMGAAGVAQPAGVESALLVASAELAGSIFARSVVLVLRVPGEETIGLILNLPTDAAPPTGLALPEGGGRLPGVYRGGPLAPGAPFAIAESAAVVAATLPVTPDVRFGAGKEAVGALLASAGERRAKLFAGYAGWAPGQLAQEISAGYWNPRSVNVEQLFDPDPRSQWQRLQASRRAV